MSGQGRVASVSLDRRGTGRTPRAQRGRGGVSSTRERLREAEIEVDDAPVSSSMNSGGAPGVRGRPVAWRRRRARRASGGPRSKRQAKCSGGYAPLLRSGSANQTGAKLSLADLQSAGPPWGGSETTRTDPRCRPRGGPEGPPPVPAEFKVGAAESQAVPLVVSTVCRCRSTFRQTNSCEVDDVCRSLWFFLGGGV